MHVFVSAATEALDDEDLSAIRRRRIGFVFQFHFLLPEFTIVDDVPIPMRRLGDGDAGAMRGRDEREPWKISSSTDRAGKALRFAWYVKRRKRVSSARWHHSWVPPFEARAAQDEGKGHPPAPG